MVRENVSDGRSQLIGILLWIVPWDYPDLSNRSTTTSPFTIVFKEAGSSERKHFNTFIGLLSPVSAFAASFMNIVVLTSVLSAGNHALFSGTRVLYGGSKTSFFMNGDIHSSIQLYLLQALTRHPKYSHGRLLPAILYMPS